MFSANPQIRSSLSLNFFKERRRISSDGDRGVDQGIALDAQMLNATTEMGNILFGIYLTALYSACKLATYHDVPKVALLDFQQSILEKALSRNRKETNIAFIIEIEYLIAQKNLKAWLLMLPLMSGLRAMLDGMDTAN